MEDGRCGIFEGIPVLEANSCEHVGVAGFFFKLARIYRNTRLMVKAGVKNPCAYIGRVHRRA